ncbi:unnamed protein product [Nezara viridula]|uniref:Uncharacterized protein n=1 Tax=Nezara viridula TaxID=85310 RepID=A0A9P0HKP9_NEZVI|nr:unnamed protein product [Nezara viridula]
MQIRTPGLIARRPGSISHLLTSSRPEDALVRPDRVKRESSFTGMIPLQLTRPGQLSSDCKRTFQSSSLPRIGPQEALISTH